MAIDERTGTPVAERRHRVHAFAGRVDAALDDILGPDGTGFVALADLGVGATRETIGDLARVINRLQGLQGRLLDHGDVLSVGTAPDDDGHTPVTPGSTAAWFAGETHATRRQARDALRVGKRLEDTFATVRRALAAGSINADQARVIVDAVDALPDFVLEAERRRAEEHLVSQALAGHDMLDLRRLGTHLLEVIDPDGVDEHLAKKLAAEEARAARTTFLELRDDGQGTVHGRFAIPGLNADMLTTALHAIASPARPAAIDRGDDVDQPRPTAEVMGQAFCDLIERIPTDVLPTAGGINATVTVSMTLETLLGGLAPATLDTGRLISAGEARRLASQCGVIPVVLGSKSEVLDLGRRVRLHTPAQRIALRVKHKTCTAAGCTVPAAWCHAHHKTPWATGGKTTVTDGTLLCGPHHRALHQPGWGATYTDDGTTHITRTVRRRQ